MRPSRLAGGLTALAVITTPFAAGASSAIESPDNGVEQMGRGSAWVARATDPLAAYYNPAGLAFQSSGAHLGASLMFLSRCFDRRGPGNQSVSPGESLPAPGTEGGPDSPVCSTGIGPNPQLAVAIRVSRKLAFGLAVVAPHAVGPNEWPETLEYEAFGTTVQQPAPNRYLLVSSSGVILFPTLSVAYAPRDDLSFGAGFVWGIATADVSNFALIQQTESYTFDTKAALSVKDLFVPGFVLGALWSASPNVDIAGWFKYQAPVDASGDLHLESPYFNSGGSPNPDCAAGKGTCEVLDVAGAGHVKFDVPMEARIGVRFHVPRRGERPKPVRDPLSDDVFDVELDVTWAHNSSVETTEVRFPSGADAVVFGGAGTVPSNGDIPRHWKDVLGVRLGGDFVAIPNRLSLRGGGWFETAGVDAKYLNLDFDPAQKFGLALGATVRLGPVDLSAAYQHTFFATLDNGGDGAIHALSGDATSDFRSDQAVNGGSLAESMNEVALGGTLHW